MVLFTHDIKICQIDQGSTDKNGAKNVELQHVCFCICFIKKATISV